MALGCLIRPTTRCPFSFVCLAMRSRILIHPVRLLPGHTAPTRNFASRPRFVRLAGLGTIAKGLKSVTLFARIPVIHDYFDSHSTTPDTTPALAGISPSVKSTMSPLAVHSQIFWHSDPWWGILGLRRIRGWMEISSPPQEIFSAIKGPHQENSANRHLALMNQSILL